MRCNLSCRHCGSDCKKEAMIEDMPKEVFFKVIDDITPHVNPNKTLIMLTGGEVLMRKDIEEIGLELYRRGFPWSMVTNAMGLTPERLDSLMCSGMRAITVSLDGFEDIHNHFRGNKNSFSRAVKAIEAISKEEELVWDIVTCVTPALLPRLEEFKEFIYSIGVRRWRLFTIVPMGRAKNDLSLQLSSEQLHELMHFIIKTRKEDKITCSYACEGFLGGYEGQVRDRFYHCSAGMHSASVLIDGSISGCTSIRSKYYQGNIYKDNFWDVWQNRFDKYRNREWMRKGECATCKEFKHCRGGGMHLRTEDGELILCHLKKLNASR